jgi:hypothetical protein
MRAVLRALPACSLVLCVLGLSGCASGAAAFQPVNLRADLDAGSLARYQGEMAAIPGAELRPLMTLESTNHWPLGLLAYWRKGVVEAVMTSGGEHLFVVSESRGYGPLSAFYVKRHSAVYDYEGRRLSRTQSKAFLWGQLMRTELLETLSPDGEWLMTGSAHALLNMLNWRAAGRVPVAFWLFSAPSPIGWGG